MPVTILLKAIGIQRREILETFFQISIQFHFGKTSVSSCVPERLRGEVPPVRHLDKARQGHRRQGQAHHRQAHP
jgi:hypothetical protein